MLGLGRGDVGCGVRGSERLRGAAQGMEGVWGQAARPRHLCSFLSAWKIPFTIKTKQSVVTFIP